MENTPEAIRAALMSYNFAKRGVTSSEQRNFLTQAIPEDPENVYYQVNVETEAGWIILLAPEHKHTLCHLISFIRSLRKT